MSSYTFWSQKGVNVGDTFKYQKGMTYCSHTGPEMYLDTFWYQRDRSVNDAYKQQRDDTFWSQQDDTFWREMQYATTNLRHEGTEMYISNLVTP